MDIAMATSSSRHPLVCKLCCYCCEKTQDGLGKRRKDCLARANTVPVRKESVQSPCNHVALLLQALTSSLGVLADKLGTTESSRRS